MAFFYEEERKPKAPVEEKPGVWTDAYNLLSASSSKMVGDYSRTGSYLTSGKGWKGAEKMFSANTKAADLREAQSRAKISPEMTEATSGLEGFAKSPGRAVIGQIAQSVPEMAGTVASGAIGSLGGPAGTAAGLFGAGYASSASRAIGEMATQVQSASNSDLVKYKPFAQKIASGMTYDKAREWLVDKMVKESSVNSAATIYGLANVFGGVEAAAVRSLVTAPVKRGVGAFAKEVGKTSLGEAGQEAVQTPVEDIVGQQARIARGAQQRYDPYQTARAGAEGAILGGITGGALGAPIHALNTRVERKPKLPPEVIPEAEQAAIAASKNTSGVPNPAAQADAVNTVATAAQQAASTVQPTPTPPAEPVQPPVAPAPAAPTITPETAPAPAPAPARPIVTEEEFLNNADQPDPDVESEILTAPTEAPLPMEVTPTEAPEIPVSKAKKARVKKTKLPPLPKGVEGVALTPESTPVVTQETVPTPAPETPAPIEPPAPVTPLEKTKTIVTQPAFVKQEEPKPVPPQPKFVKPKEVKILPDIAKEKAYKAERAKEAAAAQTAKKRAVPKGETVIEGVRPDNLVRNFETKMLKGESADPTGKRPALVAELVAKREKAANKGEAVKINKALRALAKQEAVDQKAKADRDAKEAVEAEAKAERDKPPEQKLLKIARQFSPHPVETRASAGAETRRTMFTERINKAVRAFDEANVDSSVHPFVAGARALVAKGEKVTDEDIEQLTTLQDKAMVALAPEKAARQTKAEAAETAAEAKYVEEAPAEEITAETTEQAELTDEQRTSEYTDLKVGKESSRKGPVRGIGTEGAASEGRKFTKEEIAEFQAKYPRQRLELPDEQTDLMQDIIVREDMTAKTYGRDVAKFGPAKRVNLLGIPKGPNKRGGLLILSVKPDGVTTLKTLLSNNPYVQPAVSFLSLWRGLAQGSGARLAIAQTLQRISKKVAGEVPDVKVYLVSPEVMAKLATKQTIGYYEPSTNVIVLRADMLGTPRFQVTALHEAIHAAYSDYLANSPEARKDLETLYNYIKDNHADKFKGQQTSYALHSPEEFITEALSNPQVMTILSQIELPASINKQLGVDAAGKTSALKAFFGLIARMLGVKNTTVFEGILTIQGKLEAHEYPGFTSASDRDIDTEDFNRLVSKLPAHRLRVEAPPTQGKPQQGGKWWHSPEAFTRKAWLKARAFGQLVQDADKYFGGEENNSLRTVHDWSERRRVIVSNYIDEGDKVTRKSLELSRKYPDHWENFETLQGDATFHNLHPDVGLDHKKNEHLGIDATTGWQAKAIHPELHERWKSLPDELKQHWHEIDNYTRHRQNIMTFDAVKNIVKQALGAPDDALAGRMFNDIANDADWALFKTNTVLGAINNALSLKRIDGFYAPLMRDGEYVVRGTYDLNKENLMGGTVLGDNVVQFIAPDQKRGYKTRVRKMAEAYVGQSKLKHMGTHRLYVDPTDTTKQVPPETVGAILVYRVKMQTEFMQLYETNREAHEGEAEWRAQPNIKEVKGVVRRQPIMAGGKPDMLSSEFSQIADKMIKNRGEGAISRELGAALREMSVRVLGSTRIQSRRQPRRHVRGYSTNATRSLATYNVSSAGYLGKLETQPQIDEALQKARDYEKAHATEASAKTTPRSEYLQETVERITDLNTRIPKPVDRWVNALLSVSQMDKLMSASYHIINSLQNLMVTIPYMSGRHGVHRTVRAMAEAYNMIGAGSVAWNGMADTVKAGKSAASSFGRYAASRGKQGGDLPPEVTNYLGDLRKRLANRPDLLKLFDELDFLISPDAGFEVGRLTQTRSAVATAIMHGEFIGRQVGQAVETINRTTAAIAAFNLEMAKNGGNVDAAIRYAKDTLNNTHFNYSQTNAPAFMMDKHPIMRLALQFKKYAQGMVYLMVKLGHTAISKETDPQVRREATRSLAYVMGTTAAMAGALGLPTEMFKIGVMALNLFGFMDDDWDDVERWVEENFGTTVAHGLPNMFGVDVSTRMGLNNMLLYGEPSGEDAKSRWAWWGQLVSGAPGGYAMDVATSFGKIGEAVNSGLSGDYAQSGKSMVEFMEKTVPVRQFADSIAAYRMATEGKVNKRGEVITEPSVARGLLKFVGFQSTRAAEDLRKVNYMYKDVEARDTVRQDFFNRWKEATTAAERQEIFAEVKAFNRTVPKKAQVTWKALQTSAKRAKKIQKSGAKVKGVFLGRDADLAQP